MTTANHRSFSTAAAPLHDEARAPTRPPSAPSEDGVAVFMRARPRLFAIAYRMLRSAAEAEDVVQEVWLRWQATDRTRVRNAVAFLATAARRLSLNVLQSARARHETWSGAGLPEAIDRAEPPGAEIERREALTAGLQMIWERLSPAERSAYILREAFSYAYRDIAAVLRLREANARQLVTRARRHLAGEPRRRACRIDESGVLAAFRAAAAACDVADLEPFFAAHSGSPVASRALLRAARPLRIAKRANTRRSLGQCAA